MIGTTDSDDFITSIFSTLGSKFWNLCVFDETLEAKDTSLRDGAKKDLAPLKLVGIDPLLSPSLTSRVGSLRSIYDAWKMDNLTVSMLADIPGAQGYTSFMAASPVFSIAKSALTVFLAFEKTPGPSETEGTWWFTHGGRRFAGVAERQVRSVVNVPLLNNNFPFVL